MPPQSPAHQLAEHIFETVWQQNDLLVPRDLVHRRIAPARGHITDSYQVISFSGPGEYSLPAREVLTKTKNGNYLLQATPGWKFTGERSLLGRTVITPDSPEEHALRLADSMFVRELSRIAIDVYFPERTRFNT